MQTNLMLAQFLALSLGIVMFGLGLSLTPADFTRLLKYPKAVVVALGLQAVALPLICVLLIALWFVPPILAVGMLLLAASPGGITANLFSHLFGGNVAMNISLTAINTVLSIVTLPLITNWAIATYLANGQVVPLQFGKVAEVIGIILVPVVLGMVTRRFAPTVALKADKPMKAFGAFILGLFTIIAIVNEWTAVATSFMVIGPAVVTFNILSLAAGYYLPRLTGIDRSTSTAISFEVGIHNSTMAVFVALSVLNNLQLALPAAIYSISMYITAVLFGLNARRARNSAGVAAASAS